MRSNLPGGYQMSLFGPALARVNPFRWRDLEKAMKMKGISGRSSAASSWSVVLQLSLESRLRRHLGGGGSPVYELTWKRWDTASGLPICALRASGRRTSGSDCSGWPTCSARDHKGEGHKKELTNPRPLNEVARGVTPGGSLAKTENSAGYRLNPRFSLWLMGFPVAWLHSKVLETLSSRKSRRNL
jgi:hypothetical protein